MSGHKQNRTDNGTDRLQEIRARLDAATPGPWIIHEDEETGQLDPWDDDGMHPILDSQSNADLIAHAPDDIAWLLQEVARLTLQERSLKRIHADLQSRYQIATSEKKRGYTMDVRMVNDGRTF
jgi:hypothetical protein